jgi:hypothetical protein
LTIHTGGYGIHSVAFSSEGKRLVLADEAIIPIKVWDARTGRVLATLKMKEEDWGVGEVVFPRMVNASRRPAWGNRCYLGCQNRKRSSEVERT